MLFAHGWWLVHGAEAPDAAWRELVEQNRRLQEQVRAQQQQIDELRAKVSAMDQAGERRDRELQNLRERTEGSPAAPARPARSAQEIRISGEAGLAFFRTGANGQFPNSEFRVDEAKLFVEAPVWKDVYLFAGLDLVTREANDEFFHVGELYLDFENVSAWWHQDRLLNLRVGRFNLPFGEEYQRRSAMDNPLISHSLSDIWGIDEGIEIYGAIGKLQYVAAVQNGGHKTLRDYDSDKAVVARLGFDPARWAHVSASAMRTGDLTVAGDVLSEVWFGNGFFRALGPAATTTTFSASLFQVDGVARWKGGRLSAAWGQVRFDDNDRTADNARRLRYYALEGVQQLADRLYGAARFGQIRAPRGYPLVGWGDFGTFLFRSPPTLDLQRLSLGLGYRFGPPLVWKFEYSSEHGRLINGTPRDGENLISTEIALKF